MQSDQLELAIQDSRCWRDRYDQAAETKYLNKSARISQVLQFDKGSHSGKVEHFLQETRSEKVRVLETEFFLVRCLATRFVET